MELRTSQQHDECGAVSAEYASVLVLVATLVAAILALPLGNVVGGWLEHAVCLLTGTGCGRGETATRDPAEPEYCERTVDTTSLEGQASVAIATLAGAEGYELVQRSDGTVTVTYRVDSQVGAELSAGTYGRVDVGASGGALGHTASAGVHRVDANAVTWTFDDRADADAWVQWHRAMEAPQDRYDTPLRMRWYNPLAWGRRSSLGAITETAAARAGNHLAGLFGRGLEEPPEPQGAQRFTSGGWTTEALARAGVPGIDVEARLDGASQLGQLTDLDDGSTTFFWELTGELGLSESSPLGHTSAAAAELDGRVGVTVGADGSATRLEVVTTVAGDPGLDPTSFDDPREVLGDPWDARSGAASRYEVTLSLPLDRLDLDGVLDGLTGGVADTAGGAQLGSWSDRLWEQGNVGLVEHDVRSERYGAEAIGRLGPIGAGTGGGYTRSHSDARNAHFLTSPDGGGTRGWRRWTNCLGG